MSECPWPEVDLTPINRLLGLFGGSCGLTPWRIASQQCTRTPQTSVERPFSPICVHSCIPTVVRNGATVYTSAPKRPREAVLADLCTLLRRHPRGGQPGRVRRRARAQGARRAGKRQDRRRGRDAAVGVGRPVPRGGGSSWSGTTRARILWGRPARRSRRGRPSGWPPALRSVTHPGTFRAS